MRGIVLIAMLCLTAVDADAQFFRGSNDGEFPAETTNPSALSALVATMNPGDWLVIPNTDIDDVLFTRAEHDALVAAQGGANFWGQSGGPYSVLVMWNSAAFDPVGMDWYFTGGGHADYGGNELYRFDFDTLEWARITEPAPLTIEHSTVAGAYIPDGTPISSHTYDQLTWNTTTQTLWKTGTQSGYNSTLGTGVQPDPPAYWEFDPGTGQWTQHLSERGSNNQGLYVPGEDVVLVIHSPTYSYQRRGYMIDGTGTETTLNGGAALPGSWDWSWGGNLFSIPESASPGMAGRIFIAANVMAEYSLDAANSTISQVGSAMAIPDIGFQKDGSGYAFRTVDEKIYIWEGGREVYTWEPDTNTYATLANAASAVAPNGALVGVGRIYDKWIYLEQHDVFAGIVSSHNPGVFLWKPPAP